MGPFARLFFRCFFDDDLSLAPRRFHDAPSGTRARDPERPRYETLSRQRCSRRRAIHPKAEPHLLSPRQPRPLIRI